ncbi:FAD-dependent thymidylate synthase [Limisalsivibrio acetivorans]|uniref:FAD-dependent thymidylate synthase n=1 Tax=Limisalsivibrio acetivorans TaxID=1304888 RepID=UPI0003B35266|nr:FAD-dependent thymidylate synthase [Limisalsivibrio acetivorans]
MAGFEKDSHADKQAALNVRLLNRSSEGELMAALAAKLCYSDADIENLFEKVSSSEQKSFIEKIVSIGHHSVLEHVSFTFGIEGVSRALTHQLVRHRIASFSQKSQRYVKHGDGFQFVLPDTIAEDNELTGLYTDLMKRIGDVYDTLAERGVPAEDARYVLPNACETKIIVTMNCRELLHFFSVRCCERAQWEIRRMSELMLIECIKEAPSIFSGAGPGCVRGKCPEGKFTCGRASEIREKYRNLSPEK